MVTVTGGLQYTGILAGAAGEDEMTLCLRQASLVFSVSSTPAQVIPALMITHQDLQHLEVIDVDLEAGRAPDSAGTDGFKTDVDITGLSLGKSTSGERKKPLQAWGGGDDESLESGAATPGGTLRGSGGASNWDQFATNDRITGTTTNYHEDIYTTKLDRGGADFRAREMRAAQLEREILKVRPRLAQLD